MTIFGRRTLLIAAVLGFVVLAAVVFRPASGERPPAPASGVVDLSDWDFAHTPSVPLAGEWLYFDRAWGNGAAAPDRPALPAAVPGPWPVFEPGSTAPRREGFGTYTLTVRLPAAPPGERYAIETGYIYSAYRVFANGTLIAQNGEPSTTPEHERPQVYSRLGVLPEGARDVELRIELSSHLATFGGSFIAPHIGFESALAADRFLLTALSFAIAGAMLFAATYHIAVYLLTRSGPTLLWFGVCAGLVGARTLLIEPLANYAVPFLGQDWLWRTNYVLTMLALPAVYQFFSLSFPRQIARRFAVPITLLCSAAAAATIGLGPAFGEVALKPYEALAVVTFAYIFAGVVRAAAAAEAGSYPAVVGWGFTALAVIHDILLENGLVTGINLMPFGFVTFFLCLSGTLATQFNKTLRDVETLSEKLRVANTGLEEAVRERTAQLSCRLGELERSRAELEVARTDAVSASVAKSNFLATMSHEIRTPLNAVLGLAGLLEETPLKEEQRHQVALIRESGDHLLTVINDILDLSKLDAGHIDLEITPFCPADLTKAAVELLSARAEEKGLELAFRQDGALPAAVKGDAARIRQILINLIGNAIKFTTKGDIAVTLSASPEGGQHCLCWTVADTGIGIPADRLPHLFNDFAQADSSISRRFGGTGLGLAICKRLCERMNGAIDVTTAEGKGSTFRVALRLPEGELNAAPSAASAGAADIDAIAARLGRAIRVLVVEDNITNQVVTRGILKSAALSVDIAGNGLEAIDAVTRQSYDVVLMDVQMPEMDGLTATRRIRAMGGRFETLPIVALSANAFTRDAEQCRAAGMNGHVAKPVRKELLLTAVCQALAGNASFDPCAADEFDLDVDFDRAAIDHLIESLSESAVRDLLGEFVEAARSKIRKLPELAAQTETLTIEVHALKSAARQVGAVALSRLAAELERKSAAREEISGDELAALGRHLSGFEKSLAANGLAAA